VYPGADEYCDGRDNDCNGVVDNGATGCSCPQFNYGTHSYLVCSIYKKWTQSRNYCTAPARGYYLATVNNLAEQDMLLDALSAYDNSFWIGLNDLASEDNFTWVNGESATFRAWNWGEPNNSGNEDCVEMNWAGDGIHDWNDAKCNLKRYFLCEASP
jgi:hypothetical protein